MLKKKIVAQLAVLPFHVAYAIWNLLLGIAVLVTCCCSLQARADSGACSFGFFFFKQKTAYEMVSCDWSSDVCSSDLAIRSPATDVICGYTTHSTASAAMAASIALPPSRSTCAPASLASRCGVAMTPFVIGP